MEVEKERTMKKKQENTKKKPFLKNLLVNKKTVTQDTDDPLVQWVELELYNPYKDIDSSNKTLN